MDVIAREDVLKATFSFTAGLSGTIQQVSVGADFKVAPALGVHALV